MSLNLKQHLLCLALIVCISRTLGTQCGIRQSMRGRSAPAPAESESRSQGPQAGLIVGGSQARQGDFPWIVSIYFGNTPLCGGSIISPEWILTASHCLSDKQGVTKSIRLGSIYHSTGKKHKVIKEIMHPDFILEKYYSDVALLKVSPPIQYSPGKYGKGAVGPICFPEPDVEYRGDATVAGWGAIKSDVMKATHQLLAVDVKILDADACSQYPIYDDKVSICVGFIQGGKDACQGDSGGPLQAIVDGKVYQIGIVSYGEGCGMAGKPGVYTRVQHFLPWIHEQMANN